MELHTIANVILINSRIPADKTLVLTDKSYKLVGIVIHLKDINIALIIINNV
jgi:hypothetical protein